ncbi:MFS transporter [Deinococcus planocerae]|uniref:MFS transporter n=1 Tax=Deinococcus planocerae TaxID=1737569 RepID=UPI0011AF2BD1|nr:MFS transporter [Deinococcus planocerae]
MTTHFWFYFMRKLRSLLTRASRFLKGPLGRFLAAQNFSEFGNELDRMALRALLALTFGDAEALRMIAKIESIPYIFATLLAFPLGTIAGKMSLRRAALSINILLGVATLGMFGYKIIPLVIVVQVIRRCGDSFFAAVYNRAITTIAPGAGLDRAQQMATVSGQVTKQVALVVGATLVGTIGIGVFGVNAATFMVAAVLFASLDNGARQEVVAPGPQQSAGFWGLLAQRVEEIFVDMGVGLRYALTHPTYLAMLAVFTTVQVNFAVRITAVALIGDWGMQPTALGWYEGAGLLGEIIAVVATTSLRQKGIYLFVDRQRVVKGRDVLVASVMLATTIACAGVAPNLQVGIALKILEGMATISCSIYAGQVLTLLVPAQLVATLSGFIELWRALATGSASYLIGLSASQYGASIVYTVVGSATAAALVLFGTVLLLLRRR